jgi:hypothetical protein
MRTTATRNVWLASYLCAAGLPFVRATRLPGRPFRVEFVFADPEGAAPRLTRAFLHDTAVQRLIDARRALSAALDVVHDRHVCEPADIDDTLAVVTAPRARSDEPGDPAPR